METRRDDRIAQLLQALKRSDKLHLKEAATLLGVSEMTIRRDLNSDSAPVVLLGGYIVLEPRSASHYLLSDQKTRLVEEKRKAARLAASLVQPHQTLFFDCGTTTPWIIEAIDSTVPFTAVCYSLPGLAGKTGVPGDFVWRRVSCQQRHLQTAEYSGHAEQCMPGYRLLLCGGRECETGGNLF